MSDSVDMVSLAGALEEFERVVDALQTLDLTTGTDTSLLDAHRRFEQLRRRLEPVEYRLIAQERERQLPQAVSVSVDGAVPASPAAHRAGGGERPRPRRRSNRAADGR